MKLFYLFIYKTMDSQNKKIKNTYYIVDIIFDKFTQSNYNAILASFINHDYLEMFIIKELKCDTLRDYKRRYRCFIHFIKPTLMSFTVCDITNKLVKRNSAPTFTTSTSLNRS